MAADPFAAYCAGTAGAVFGAHFAVAGDRCRAVRRAARALAPDVADALDAQNARLAPSPARDAGLGALRAGAAAVVTGQQVGLFLGPLFTVYKAASAVRAARALAAESGRPVVPVFWLQTEDHDLPEVACCHLPGDDGPLAVALPASADDRIPLAHRTLPGEVAGCLAAVGDRLAGLPHAAAHVARLARHYRPGAGWGDAFAGVLAELFADEGLVIVDPRDPALARAAAAVHRRALAEAGSLADALDTRAAALADAGWAAAVHVRPGAPLSFFHPDGPAGPRRRLVPTPDGSLCEVGGTATHTTSALLAVLDADPLRFSTSALLRPVLQDTLLPTAAYVAGPGEIAYFAQLPPVYAAYGLTMPLLVPRARCRVLDAATSRLLARLGAAADDLARPLDELLARAHADDGVAESGDAFARALCAAFDAALDARRGSLADAGPGVATAIEKTRATVAAAVARLAAKVERARLHRDADALAALRRAQALLFPRHQPQERVYGLPWFAGRVGDRAFVRGVLDAIAPFDPTPRDLEEGTLAATVPEPA